MPSILTTRLRIQPTHKNCWSICDRMDDQMIGKLFFKEQWFNILLNPQSLRLGVATEASYGLMKALNSEAYLAKTSVPHAQQFLRKLGFVPQGDHFKVTIEQLTYPDLYQQLNQDLDINTKALLQPRHFTAAQLVDAEIDCFDRPTKLHPKALLAWQQMRQAAEADDIDLQLVSAFRSLSYQAGLIQKKINAGQSLDHILTVNTAPGHSEHHTGCAIDLTTAGSTPLEPSFEQTEAFDWLQAHGQAHGFVMSYPKNNGHGMIYEPWHWCYQPPKQLQA